ncbi:BUD32 protein kinase [Coniosporium apollinis CBS 100218]|uniref:EKC/KEOPS complex subunit BUD32 n=1 Tax=Coniosporium apollinis (strain CBS 100218) TaxID=1168221 RepID=R7Z4N0_CONA1|nr:BUD32 protein kinase [Coniosporium apollinis CBS 100218]EON69125.1 BUD32 protein kinase [Coniosporium apollinis CBS 100218]
MTPGVRKKDPEYSNLMLGYPPQSSKLGGEFSKGAEALIFQTSFLTPSIPAALKFRPPKPYRHPTLDKRLMRQRTLAEARCLVKCRRGGVRCPGVLAVDWEAGVLVVEWVEGVTVRRCLDAWVHTLKRERRERAGCGDGGSDGGHEGGGLEADGAEAEQTSELWDLMRRVGRAVGRLHEIGVVHGDLTTSNLMLRPARRKAERAPNPEPGQESESSEAAAAAAAAATGTTEDATSSTPVPPTTVSTTSAEAAPSPPPPPTQPPPQEPLTSLAGDIVLIDFGLATQTIQDEDRAVDLYVLERAFGSTHPAAEPLFREVLRVYGTSYKGADVVLRRLEEVRGRGRKRSMVG